MRNKKYSLKKNFVNRRALQFLPFMMVGTVKNRPLNADAISAGEKFIFQYFGKPRWSQIILDLDRFMGIV